MDRKSLERWWVVTVFSATLAACSSGLPDEDEDDSKRDESGEEDASAGERDAGAGEGGRAAAGEAGRAAAGSGGGGGSGGSGGATARENPTGCGKAESPANDTAETATPYTTGTVVTGCIASDDDADYYEVQAPAGDKAGGYYVLSITNVGKGDVDVKTWVASDNTQLGGIFNGSEGGSLYGAWSAAPGQKYRFAVGPYHRGAEPFTYDLRVDYTKIDEASEPNDTRDTPTALTLGTSVTGYMFDGFEGGERSRENYEDWYRFDANAGQISIKLENVAIDIVPQILMIDSTGATVSGSTQSNSTGGGGLDYTQEIETGGSYRLVVRPLRSLPATFDRIDSPAEVPESFTKPYKLTVSQL